MDLLRLTVVLLLALPAAAAAGAALLGPTRAALVRRLCLAVTFLDFVLAVVVTVGFLNERTAHPLDEPAEPGKVATFRPEFVPGSTADDPHRTTWNLLDLGRLTGESAVTVRPIQFYLGVDGLNVWLILLTTLLMITAVLVSWHAIEERVHEYHAWLMLLGTAMLGVFLSFDVILFYVFFELTLVPLFFLIGIWGGPERRHAARKFFIYTLAGSLITFLGILAIVLVVYKTPLGGRQVLTFAVPELISLVNTHLAQADGDAFAYWQTVQWWVFLAMMVGFAVKVPLFPVHTWLPLAHVEAPTAGSVLLAGVLLKLGTYGFMRLTLPLVPDAAYDVGLPLIGTLSVVGILYGAFCARAQDDIKKLVAYSSVSHMGFCTLGMFALNAEGLTGGLMQMINHGLSTGAMFLIVGMLYERYHTRMMSDYGGMASRLGLLSAAMVVVCLSSVGLPGLNGFIGEALVFFGMFDRRPMMAVIASAGIVLGAWYLFTMLRIVFFGTLKEPAAHDHHESHGGHAHVPPRDLTRREIAILAPILAACLWLGVYPQPVLDSVRPDIHVVAGILQSRPGVAAETPAPAAVAAANPIKHVID